MTLAPMHPFRFWLLFLALATAAILFAGRLPAASAAGKIHTRKTHSGKPVNTPIVKNKPTVKLGMAYIAELQRR